MIDTSPWKWWGRKRLKYNFALAVTGVISFIAYALLISVFIKYFNQAEITIITTIFQAVAYLCAMAVANIFYFIGPVCEIIFKPKDIEKYRNISYKSGLYFSVCLPPLIPLAVLCSAMKSMFF